MTNTIDLPMKREQSLLTIMCLAVALGFFILVIYNLFAAGSVISTDGLFYTVVPLVLALPFLAIPVQEFLARRHQEKLSVEAETSPAAGTKRAQPAGVPAPSTVH